MSSDIPIQFSEILKLQNLGVKPQCITFSTVTMESDKFICVRDVSSTPRTINIVDVESQKLTTNKVNAESAIMNPTSKVLALRAGNTLQIFNLDMKAKMKQHQIDEPIHFWTWISPKTIAIVTKTAVYHWGMEGNSGPKKVFEKHSNFDGATVINYRVDKHEKWLLLIGLKKTPEGFMQGVMQLYSTEKKVTQPIEGHAAAFLDYRLSNNYTATLVCIAKNTPQGGKLFVMEVPGPKPQGSPVFQRRVVDIPFSAPNDFPVAMQVSEKHGCIYMITKAGFLFVYHAGTAQLIYKSRISADTIFVTAASQKTNGLIGMNKSGQALSVAIDDNNIVQYLTKTNTSLAIEIASYANLGGADDLYATQFTRYLQMNDIMNAVKVAADSPQGILRTPDTIRKLQQMPVPQGSKPPLSLYFQRIIETGSLNQFESLELAKIVLQKQHGSDYIQKLINENKMEGSEALGDLVQSYNPDLAMKIYLKGQAHQKIIDNLLRVGDYERVLAYCQKVDFAPDYLLLFRNLCQVNRDSAVKFAAKIHTTKPGQLDPNTVVDIFVQAQMIKQATAFLLKILEEDLPEDAHLQTRLLEINLMFAPVQVADSILGQNMFSHYDHEKIARLCEKVGLHQRALENYTQLADRKRVILNTQYMNTDWLVSFFGNNLSAEDSLECLRELLNNNIRQNLNLAVQVAQKYSNELGPDNLVKLFEDFRSFEGIFYYLGAIVDATDNAEVVFKYIQAAVKVGQIPEVERVTREIDVYDPEKVKEFLKNANLKNEIPLMNVCDKHDFVEEMVHYLYNQKKQNFIDVYVKTRNPLKTPNVIGALLDVDASEDYISNLVMGVGNLCPVEPLVAEVEKRNRLKLLRSWLEARQAEGSEEPACHNALAKIYIDINHNPDEFLKTNQFYDSRVVGKYCEKRDPHLAFIAYERGQCDEEIVQVTSSNSMFKQLARYLVQRQNEKLWRLVLVEENENRRQIIDQVVQTALPECKSAEEVSITVKAFIACQLPNELIELLEQIVLQGQSEFRTNKSLQNLLVLTAIKTDPDRVMGYIEKLDAYDGPDIAQIAIEKGLYEEAFFIYNKFKLNEQAIGVLIENIGSIERASEFADNIATPAVWSILGKAQMTIDEPLVAEGIECFMKANDASYYKVVTTTAEKTGHFADLIKYLLMARRQIQDTFIDTELVYAYARNAAQDENNSHSLADLEDFITGPNTAQILNVGERCFEEGLYEAAKILFSSINNFSRLASALVKLGKLRDAVAAANKANSIKTFKEVMNACIEAGDFRYAQSCGLNIIVHADELDDLIYYYESRGHFKELIALLEKGLGIDGAHKGIFTSLGVMYARYTPEKVMEHIQRYYRRCHIPKLINECELNHLWAEIRFLYRHSDEFDLAVKVMIEHSPEAWDHSIFTDTIIHVANLELYYKSINFYLEENPQHIVDLLSVLTPKLDHERVAKMVQNSELHLIKKYLEVVQDENLSGVNQALNGLYVEEEDYKALRASIEAYGNFDQISLAKNLKSHELLEFRRISAWIYRMNKKFAESITLSKQDKLYKDAMETAAESQDRDLTEDLLQFFVKEGLKECFAACLYNCYSLIRPDVALELAWRNNIQDYVMPFMIQVLREYTTKVDNLEEKKSAKNEEQESQSAETANVFPPQTEYFPPQQPFPMPTGMDQMNPMNPGGYF